MSIVYYHYYQSEQKPCPKEESGGVVRSQPNFGLFTIYLTVNWVSETSIFTLFAYEVRGKVHVRVHKTMLVCFNSQEQKIFVLAMCITVLIGAPQLIRHIIPWSPVISSLGRSWAGCLLNPKYEENSCHCVSCKGFICDQFHFWFVVGYK